MSYIIQLEADELEKATLESLLHETVFERMERGEYHGTYALLYRLLNAVKGADIQLED